jgi:hypothetical protein
MRIATLKHALLGLCVVLSLPVWADDRPTTGPARTLILAVGAAGEEPFGEEFRSAAKAWQGLAEKQNWQLTTIGLEADSHVPDRERLRQAIAEGESLQGDAELWLVLIGHGTYTGNTAKFNLVGPDVSANDINDWLKPIKVRTAIINCSSSSAPFLTILGAPDRVVITATRSGTEQNYARFGKYLAESLCDMTADVDHDREISLLEVFLAATSRTERFYREEARLATEHALIDDNGDRVGTGGDFYRGVRPAKEAEAGKKIDGRVAAQAILFSAPNAIRLTAEQQSERQRIEGEMDALRSRKGQLSEQAYLDQIEPLLVELSRIYERADR